MGFLPSLQHRHILLSPNRRRKSFSASRCAVLKHSTCPAAPEGPKGPSHMPESSGTPGGLRPGRKAVDTASAGPIASAVPPETVGVAQRRPAHETRSNAEVEIRESERGRRPCAGAFRRRAGFSAFRVPVSDFGPVSAQGYCQGLKGACRRGNRTRSAHPAALARPAAPGRLRVAPPEKGSRTLFFGATGGRIRDFSGKGSWTLFFSEGADHGQERL